MNSSLHQETWKLQSNIYISNVKGDSTITTCWHIEITCVNQCINSSND